MIAPSGIENTQDKHLGLASWKNATDSKSKEDLTVIGIDPPFSASLGALNVSFLLLFVSDVPYNALIPSAVFFHFPCFWCSSSKV